MTSWSFYPRRCARSLVLFAAAVCLAAPALGQASPVDVTLPSPKQRVDADYPASELAARKVADVELVVTVNRQGAVAAATVVKSGGPAFDAAAVSAVQRWSFNPAQRAGEPVASRIRVAFHFEPPEESEPPVTVEPQAPTAAPAAQTKAAAKPSPQVAPPPAEIVVVGHADAPSRGASDYNVTIGKLSQVPHRDAASLLRLAPGVLLTSEGGTGHPYQIFLRGFDAREGQDIEFTIDGVPINEVGNPHGNGLVDTHFIIPELVRTLRVVEGPFAPEQGNFAVAGSAAYDVGVAEPGLTLQGTAGSFNTKRLLLMWHPEGGSDHTFGGAELFSTDGFGPNRAAERATAMGGFETLLGASTTLRLLASTYATHYAEAGVLRLDDVQSGRKGFFDTNDTSQGGDSSRHSLAATIDNGSRDTRLTQSLFVTLRDFRLRQNLTGYLQDPQETWQSEHSQRGDLIDQQSSTTTFGGRGSARKRWQALGSTQELELGYFGRYDRVDATQRRDRFETTTPYRTDLDLLSDLSNVGAYFDTSLKPLHWVTVRGGLRADYYHYLVKNRCALTAQTSFGGDPLDTECFESDRVGYRSAEQTASTSASALQPRVSLLLGAFQGFQLSVSHGRGSRSIDPQYVNQDLKSPFARVAASELGVSFARSFSNVDVQARSVFFQTRVDKDLFFNETEGRNTLSNGTTRTGWAGNVRATGSFFDLAANLTLVRATFDDSHLAIPYAPGLVARVDGVLFGRLPLGTSGSIGTGISYVGRRPLPYEELSATTFLVDLAASLRWRAVTLGVTTTNLFDRRYRLGEYNYVSDFHSQDYPTLVAARHFTAGEPRAIYGTLAVTIDGLKVSL
ncbi:MAG TPA: TonB family protein [Polyangiaceae bacterium]|nr:TonB family protein [Polyangiaceae bacterium]